ncbi:MAG: sugar phosphate nucleotidyltransferase, partial [Nanoarchaeota archaeon]
VNIKYSYEKNELLGTAGAIKNAEHLINGTFLVANGDTYLDVDFKKLTQFHENYQFPFTMVIADATHPKTQELVELNGNDILKIHKRNTLEHEDYLRITHRPLVNGGAYVMNKEILEYIPPGKKVSLEQEIFPQIINKIKGFIHTGYMLDIADKDDWQEFKKDIHQGLILSSVVNRQKIIRSRAPLRITFGGGGTDMQPYDEKYGGMCVNAAINRYVYATLKLREDKKITIKSDIINIHGGFETYEKSFQDLESVDFINDNPLKIIQAVILEMQPGFGFDLYVRSDVPPHSGLGASASLCVSVIGALNHLRKKNRLTKHEIAETSYRIEEKKMGIKGGRQDQYASVFGGINMYEFKGNDNVRVNPIETNKDHILELEKNLLILSSGRRVKSSGEMHQQEDQTLDLTEKIKNLHDLKDTAREIEFNLRRGNLRKFGELILEGWKQKKQ